jgi:phospho-N-acetylmuramoyl-pentapeptide-transferase
VFRKNKEGLHGHFKIIGQVGLGLIVGTILCFNQQAVIREVVVSNTTPATQIESVETKSTKTTIPFVKENEFDYTWLWPFKGPYQQAAGWVIYIIAVIFIITAVSNGTNLTDGMDGLATGITIVVGVTLGILAYLSGNVIYAKYLNIMYIPNSGELVVFMAALVGALIGFLWYNAYPAQVFMGDTGSLALGGIVAVFAVLIRKELLIPVLCGIYLVESLSVIVQRYYFKYTKHKYGAGHRIFRMAPLHHHFQKEGVTALITTPKQILPEAKIVIRFWIVAVLLAAITVITLKVR